MPSIHSASIYWVASMCQALGSQDEWVSEMDKIWTESQQQMVHSNWVIWGASKNKTVRKGVGKSWEMSRDSAALLAVCCWVPVPALGLKGQEEGVTAGHLKWEQCEMAARQQLWPWAWRLTHMQWPRSEAAREPSLSPSLPPSLPRFLPVHPLGQTQSEARGQGGPLMPSTWASSRHWTGCRVDA